MYFEDLTAYGYRDGPDVVSLHDRIDRSSPPFPVVEPTASRVSVGWLGGHRRFVRRTRFPTGQSSHDVIDALIDVIAAQAVNVTRGFHRCEYCPAKKADAQLEFVHRGRTIPLGSSEIRVPAADASVFAAPTLIAHYVRDHRYCPPPAFTDVLMAFRHSTADLARGWFAA
ncbi:hypothetical protein Caci_6909 [Catenulispora acidiphila DSM 44928]|uniref:DUF7919 domain-containing protein n=1 Tax=Catenulispora acidiphila (strain DSM 44928 / JCM 14897 / NBRC 102108 / NRRL B-24433 / ID139908) TaxID=479433 RepID=C7Q3I1_CATAD|nr:hypothetical protein [Catenulispora acidiphila]ACU75746.1 hypothetical protein Caci_6909 [Catenulispora acidiphila DSM 44928]